jgi:hypothetical protein
MLIDDSLHGPWFKKKYVRETNPPQKVEQRRISTKELQFCHNYDDDITN